MHGETLKFAKVTSLLSFLFIW